jgi:hypothetical protein
MFDGVLIDVLNISPINRSKKVLGMRFALVWVLFLCQIPVFAANDFAESVHEFWEKIAQKKIDDIDDDFLALKVDFFALPSRKIKTSAHYLSKRRVLLGSTSIDVAYLSELA